MVCILRLFSFQIFEAEKQNVVEALLTSDTIFFTSFFTNAESLSRSLSPSSSPSAIQALRPLVFVFQFLLFLSSLQKTCTIFKRKSTINSGAERKMTALRSLFPMHKHWEGVRQWSVTCMCLSEKQAEVIRMTLHRLSSALRKKKTKYPCSNINQNRYLLLDLSRVYPTSRPMTAGIGSSPPATRPTD